MAKRVLELENFIPYRLSFTANLVSTLIADAYEKHFDLSIPQWRVLAHVAERDGITQQEIGHRTRMEKVTVSRAAVALQKRKLLIRVENPDDKRCLLLVLTPSGRTLYNQISPKALELEASIFDRYDCAELAKLIAMLREIDMATLALLDN
ncbi:MarR family transcriptional regulator [soil metagenome]